jgi:thioredoxin-related protein
MKKIVLLALFLVFNLFGSELKVEKTLCDAVKVAKQTNRPIAFFITRDNCKYCKVLKTKTLKQKKIIATLNKNFVVVMANFDKGDYIPGDLINVKGVPSIWFLYNNGLRMYENPAGAPQKVQTFIEMLDTVKKRYDEISKMIAQQQAQQNQKGKK